MKINITPRRLAAIAKSEAGKIPSFLKKEIGAMKTNMAKPSVIDTKNAQYNQRMKDMETKSAWQKEYNKNKGK